MKQSQSSHPLAEASTIFASTKAILLEEVHSLGVHQPRVCLNISTKVCMMEMWTIVNCKLILGPFRQSHSVDSI